MINKSASRIGKIVFAEGGSTALYIGANRNTGETIVWQDIPGRRSRRTTGRNIPKLASELDHCLREGEATWEGEVNDAALRCLQEYLPV